MMVLCWSEDLALASARTRHNEPALIRAQLSWPRQPRPRRQTSGVRQLALANLVSPWRRSSTSTAPWPDGACVCMVARWLAVRRGQVETVWRGAAVVVPRLCSRWLLRLHWRDNHDGRCGHGGDQADAQHFHIILQGSRRRTWNVVWSKNGGSGRTSFIARGEFRA